MVPGGVRKLLFLLLLLLLVLLAVNLAETPESDLRVFPSRLDGGVMMLSVLPENADDKDLGDGDPVDTDRVDSEEEYGGNWLL